MMNQKNIWLVLLAGVSVLAGEIVASAALPTYTVKTVRAQTYFIGDDRESDCFTDSDQDVLVVECSDEKITEMPINLVFQFAVESNEPSYVHEQDKDGDLSNERVIYSLDSAKALFDNYDNAGLTILLGAMVVQRDRNMLGALLCYVHGSFLSDDYTEFTASVSAALGAAAPSQYVTDTRALLATSSAELETAVAAFMVASDTVMAAGAVAAGKPVRAMLKRRGSMPSSPSDEGDDELSEEEVAAATVRGNDDTDSDSDATGNGAKKRKSAAEAAE